MLTGLLSCKNKAAETLKPQPVEQGIYAYKVEGLKGDTIDFAAFKGKKILVVNTASECSYTYQYEALEALYRQYKGTLIIVGFPTNDFGGQEPGSNEEIEEFCRENYGVSFPMSAKVSVKGSNIAPIYKWLTDIEQNGHSSTTIEWNFQKYLINEQGKLTQIFPPATEPFDDAVISAIEN
ncbi:MAG: glutathione peroxidase [Taibaiella sp.]|nr:glutathione peroxidase [Taibaiella sp.]